MHAFHVATASIDVSISNFILGDLVSLQIIMIRFLYEWLGADFLRMRILCLVCSFVSGDFQICCHCGSIRFCFVLLKFRNFCLHRRRRYSGSFNKAGDVCSRPNFSNLRMAAQVNSWVHIDLHSYSRAHKLFLLSIPYLLMSMDEVS